MFVLSKMVVMEQVELDWVKERYTRSSGFWEILDLVLRLQTQRQKR